MERFRETESAAGNQKCRITTKEETQHKKWKGHKTNITERISSANWWDGNEIFDPTMFRLFKCRISRP